MPDITGELGTGTTGTPVPDRAVSLSGWFSRGRFSALTGLDGDCSVGYLSYVPQSGYDWLLVDYADRLYDWGNYCGIPGGIPERTTIYTTLTSSATAAQINAAIAACPSGQVVYLAAGTYNIGNLTFINKTGVTLRGAGPGQTILRPTGSGRFIDLPSADYTEASGINVSSGYTRGSTAIVLSSTPGAQFQAGNIVYISEENSPDKWATDIGIYLRNYPDYHPTRYNVSPGTGYGRTFTYSSRIESVVGNTINLATPIPVAFSTTGIRAYPPDSTSKSSLCGIENLTIDGNGNANYTHAIRMYTADRCWVKNVEIDDFSGGDTGLIGLVHSFQCEVRRCYVHDCQDFPLQQDGQGICFDFFSCNCLAVDNIANRVASIQQINATGACASIYNLGINTARASATQHQPALLHHGGHNSMTLFEGNVCSMHQSDGYHGSSSHDVFFRNNFNGLSTIGQTTYRSMIQLERWNYYYSCVGNVLGDPSWVAEYYENNNRVTPDNQNMMYTLGYAYERYHGIDTSYYDAGYPDPNVPATILRHGNYDYYNNGTIWDSGISERSIPNSLFYSSKPTWFGSLEWPAIGPDLGTMVNDTPARRRWNAYQISGQLADLFEDEV